MAKIVNSQSHWELNDLIRKVAGDIVASICDPTWVTTEKRDAVAEILRDKFLPRLPNCELPNYGQTSLKVG